MRINKGEHYILDRDLHLDEELLNYGTLEFARNKSVKFTTTKNVINEGVVIMMPKDHSVTHFTQFQNVNENAFKGGGMVPIASDVGWWNMAGGHMKVKSTYKKPYTQSTADIKKGETSLTLVETTGWQPNDEIVVCYHEEPMEHNADWDDRTNSVVDFWLPRFERRRIRGISGTSVTIDALQFEHMSVDGVMPYVLNLSRNVKICGTKNGRSHIFSCAHGQQNPDGSFPHYSQPHDIDGLEAYDLGPRKVQPGIHPNRPTLVSGRYGLHFHHIGWGAKDSVVQNCSLHDCGNRMYVPHMSHGITFKNNVAFDSLESMFWWDWQEISHSTTWEKNIMVACRLNGIEIKSVGMELSLGDDNAAIDNIAIYAHAGDTHGGGAYTWNADNEAVWKFKGNVAIGCHSPLWVWQVTVNMHLIEDFKAYNCTQWHHGSYGGNYVSDKIYLYNTQLHPAATSFHPDAGWHNGVFNGTNKLDRLVIVTQSPFTSYWGHQLRNIKFLNDRNGVTIDCSGSPSDDIPGGKIVDIINCEFTNIQKQLEFIPGNFWGRFRVQDANGKAYQIENNGQRKDIKQFAALKNGTGSGLTAEYYNGKDFNTLAVQRTDLTIYFQQWDYDFPTFQLGVHNKVKVPFSIRWTGKIEPLWSEPTVFKLEGPSGYRMWLDGRLIIDAWFEKGDSKEFKDSAPQNLQVGKQYDIKVECYHASQPNKGIIIRWKSPSMPVFQEISHFQLHPTGVTQPPPPPNKRPTAFAGADKEITLPLSTVTLLGSATDPENGPLVLKWIQVSGPSGAVLQPAAENLTVTNMKEGSYVFRLTATDDKGDTASDEVAVVVKPAIVTPPPPNRLPTANAGSDVTITLPNSTVSLTGDGVDTDGTIAGFAWEKISGPNGANIKTPNARDTVVGNLIEGEYVFRLTVTDDKGGTANDEVVVTVKPVVVPVPVERVFELEDKAGKSSDFKLQADGTLKIVP
jgi:hypothetical protein